MGTPEDRIEHIRRAAIPVFAAKGFRGTSMADLAEAAGMSRPALYQYVDNRADVFRAAMAAILDDAADAALDALGGPAGTVADLAERLDGYLQRSSGDLYESLATLPHGAEIIDAKHETAADVASAAVARRRRGLERFLRRERRLRGRRLTEVADLVDLSPIGLRADEPDPAVLRRRLTTLARSVATMLEADAADP